MLSCSRTGPQQINNDMMFDADGLWLILIADGDGAYNADSHEADAADADVDEQMSIWGDSDVDADACRSENYF